MTEKRVAILLATYNGEKYITEQLTTIRNQTHTHFTVYIHDDGSKDRTVEFVQRFCDSDDRFHLIDGPSCGGAKGNFFFLMECVQDEDYIMFSDQDDYWNEDKIEVSLDAMIRAESQGDIPICVYSNLEVVDENLKTICSSFYEYSGKNPFKNDLPNLIMNNVVVGCTMMVNRSLVRKGLELIDRDLLFMHDWWLALIACEIGKLIYIEQPLMKYRQHSSNVVGAYQKRKIKNRITDFITLRNWKANRGRMQRSVNFSKALDGIISGSEHKELIHKMAQINNHGWVFRTRFYVKNGLINRNQIWKIIWI